MVSLRDSVGHLFADRRVALCRFSRPRSLRAAIDWAQLPAPGDWYIANEAHLGGDNWSNAIQGVAYGGGEQALAEHGEAQQAQKPRRGRRPKSS